MSNHDPISDMLTRIRNASQKKHTTTTIPGSKMSLSIAKVLQKEGLFLILMRKVKVTNHK